MNAEQVVDKILSEANAEAEKIKTEANDKIAAEEAELQTELADYQKQTETLAQQAAQEKRSRMLAAARMDIRKQHLTAKIQLLDEVFIKARQKLNDLSDQQYQEFISALMIKAVETGDEEVITGKQEKRIDLDLIKQVNRKLGPGLRGNLRLSDTKAGIDGGFILKRGKIQLNASIGVLLATVRENLEIQLAADLFGQDNEPKASRT